MQSLSERIAAIRQFRKAPKRLEFLQWLKFRPGSFDIAEVVEQFDVSRERAYAMARYAASYKLVEQIGGTTAFRIIR